MFMTVHGVPVFYLAFICVCLLVKTEKLNKGLRYLYLYLLCFACLCLGVQLASHLFILFFFCLFNLCDILQAYIHACTLSTSHVFPCTLMILLFLSGCTVIIISFQVLTK